MKYLRTALLLLAGIGVLTPGFGLPPGGSQGLKTFLHKPRSLRRLLAPRVTHKSWSHPRNTFVKHKGPFLHSPFFSSHAVFTPRPPLRFTYPAKDPFLQFSQEDPQLALFSKQQTDAFIFDLDGTLLDSLDAWENSAVNYLQSRGIEPYPGLQKEMEELSLLDGARILKERYQLEGTPEELVNDTLRPIGEHYYRDIPAKAQVPFLLAYLHEQGIKMVVATASHADFARGALERLGLLDYFEFIITCDEAGAGKRSPLVYETAVKRLGTEKSRTVVVEDALYALKTAHEAGFKTIGVADIHSFNDFLQIQQTADLFLDLE